MAVIKKEKCNILLIIFYLISGSFCMLTAIAGSTMPVNEGELGIVLFTLLYFLLHMLFFFYCGFKRLKMLFVLNKYKTYIFTLGKTTIKNFAECMNENEIECLNNLLWLIKKKMLCNVVLDYYNKTIIFNTDKAQKIEEIAQQFKYINVVCKCCLGTTRIRKKDIGKCSYCGAPIKFEEV